MSKTNPFRPGRVVHPGMFAGRSAEVAKLFSILTQTQSGNAEHFMIQGVRGIGKSSLLTVVLGLAVGTWKFKGESFKFLTASIDLHDDNTYVGILRSVARQLRKAAEASDPIKSAARLTWDFVKRLEIAGVKYRANGDHAPEDEDEWLDELVDHIVAIAKVPGHDGVLIVIDEADKPPPDAHLGRFTKLLSEKLGRQRCDNVCLGLAGLPTLSRKLRESHASSARIFEPLPLRPLTRADCKRAVQLGIDHANETNTEKVAITDEALELIADWSDGFPGIVQEFAYSAFARDDDGVINASDVQEGATGGSGAYERLGERYFNELFYEQVQSDSYRQMLRFMSNSGTNWVKKEAIRQGTKLSPSIVTNGINALTSRELIIPRTGMRGQYRLASRALATWINQFTKPGNGLGYKSEEDEAK